MISDRQKHSLFHQRSLPCIPTSVQRHMLTARGRMRRKEHFQRRILPKERLRVRFLRLPSYNVTLLMCYYFLEWTLLNGFVRFLNVQLYVVYVFFL